jgi:DnaJ-class molecular chaperone
MVGAMGATSDESRTTCTPCRGTGKLTSGLGGNPHEVTCPWCGGTGEFQPGFDAQQAGPADATQGPPPASADAGQDAADTP